MIIKVFRNQVVEAKVPHRTPQSPLIRDILKYKITNPTRERMFIFHADTTAWTSVSLDSTEAEPHRTQLTGDRPANHGRAEGNR